MAELRAVRALRAVRELPAPKSLPSVLRKAERSAAAEPVRWEQANRLPPWKGWKRWTRCG